MEPDCERRKQTDPAIATGIHARVVAALSLRGDRVWQQLSSIVVAELADHVQPPAFGALRIVLPTGQFTGGRFCSAHGDEVYFGDDSRGCLAVYRDDALQRRIGEGELTATGSAVVGDTVFVVDDDAHCVCVYPRAGGARLRHFGSRGYRPGEISYQRGIAACRGRMHVGEEHRVSVFTEDGAFCAHVGGGDLFIPRGVAADADEVFVASDGGDVWVFRADNLALERLIGRGALQKPWDVCVSGGVLVVCDRGGRRVVAFDVATGDLVASLAICDGFTPYGVAVRADGTLFVTAIDRRFARRLYAAQLL